MNTPLTMKLLQTNTLLTMKLTTANKYSTYNETKYFFTLEFVLRRHPQLFKP